MTASTLHGQQNVSCADQHKKKKGRLNDAGSKEHQQQEPQAMRAAAVPANAGEAGVYATSRTPKSLAALDSDATRKPAALGEERRMSKMTIN